MLDPILERQIIVKGRSKLIKLADQEFDYDDKFRLYMTSRLANPHFSPELAAKATIIDFTVTYVVSSNSFSVDLSPRSKSILKIKSKPFKKKSP
jgi:hypothetical protein